MYELPQRIEELIYEIYQCFEAGDINPSVYIDPSLSRSFSWAYPELRIYIEMASTDSDDPELAFRFEWGYVNVGWKGAGGEEEEGLKRTEAWSWLEMYEILEELLDYAQRGMV